MTPVLGVATPETSYAGKGSTSDQVATADGGRATANHDPRRSRRNGEPAPAAAPELESSSRPAVHPQSPALAFATELDAELTGVEVRAQVISASDANEIRRRRASNPDLEPLGPPRSMDGSLAVPRKRTGQRKVSRVLVGDDAGPRSKKRRALTPNSLNLMVAIAGVLLTITIQQFATTPVDATGGQRIPLHITYPSSLEPVMAQTAQAWQRTPSGGPFLVELQESDAQPAVKRALGGDGNVLDVWIPSDSNWSSRYNEVAPAYHRHDIQGHGAIVQTPVVLIARDDHAAVLAQRFPNHIIPSWQSLAQAADAGASHHLGLTDPQTSGAGAMARYSMAREWSQLHGVPLSQAATSNAMWKWMDTIEANVPALQSSTNGLVKNMVLGTTGNYWWAIAYESDALNWIAQGKGLQIYYLPHTDYADHPFFNIDRLGASGETAAAGASFEQFLRSPAIQTSFLRHGYRPTEISPSAKVAGNPFLSPANRALGVRLDGLPGSDRVDPRVMKQLCDEWSRRYGA